MSGMRCTEDQDGWQVHESFVLVTSALKDRVGKNATLFAGKNATLREKDARDRNKRKRPTSPPCVISMMTSCTPALTRAFPASAYSFIFAFALEMYFVVVCKFCIPMFCFKHNIHSFKKTKCLCTDVQMDKHYTKKFQNFLQAQNYFSR